MTLRERLERWRARRRLARGRCRYCRRILPDDVTDGVCDDCRDFWLTW